MPTLASQQTHIALSGTDSKTLCGRALNGVFWVSPGGTEHAQTSPYGVCAKCREVASSKGLQPVRQNPYHKNPNFPDPDPNWKKGNYEIFSFPTAAPTSGVGAVTGRAVCTFASETRREWSPIGQVMMADAPAGFPPSVRYQGRDYKKTRVKENGEQQYVCGSDELWLDKDGNITASTD